MEEKNCPVCNSKCEFQHQHDPVAHFWNCPVCGRYQYFPSFSDLRQFNLNHLGAYLAYNGFMSAVSEYRYFTTMSQARCEELKKEFESGNEGAYPIHLTSEDVENWYPHTFTEKIDCILLYLYRHTRFVGEQIHFSPEQIMSWLFVDCFDYSDVNSSPQRRSSMDLYKQATYMLDYLSETVAYVSVEAFHPADLSTYWFTLSPGGAARVDELQSRMATGKDVLVAMKFGDDTKLLREAIRTGIVNAGYHAIFIDEVEHNGFITPELLKAIRDSRFVVVDLTHQNNGAYFEEGYAMGLGKSVIQLCKSGTTLHFDIAQKNTIIWETEEEVSDRLTRRIRATIE